MGPAVGNHLASDRDRFFVDKSWWSIPTDQATTHHLIPVIDVTRTCADRRSAAGYVGKAERTPASGGSELVSAVPVVSAAGGSQWLSVVHRRALSRNRATAADWARAGQSIDHSARISGLTILRAMTPGSAWAP